MYLFCVRVCVRSSISSTMNLRQRPSLLLFGGYRESTLDLKLSRWVSLSYILSLLVAFSLCVYLLNLLLLPFLSSSIHLTIFDNLLHVWHTHQTVVCLFLLLFVFVILGIGARASNMLIKHSTTEQLCLCIVTSQLCPDKSSQVLFCWT